MNKVFSLVKKHALVGVLVVVIVALTVSQFEVKISSKGGENKVLSFEERADADTEKSEGELPGLTPKNLVDTELGSLDGVPHLYCAAQIEYTTLPTSTSFNANYAYPTYMMGSGENFQDINGDNLVDYTWNNINISGNESIYEVLSRSCVFLNNGNGWTRASICYANTKANASTGQVIEAEYRGDCADTSASKEQKVE